MCIESSLEKGDRGIDYNKMREKSIFVVHILHDENISSKEKFL